MTSLRILGMVLAVRAVGQPPTVRGMMTALGFTGPNGVQEHLVALRKMGMLTWEHGRAATATPTCRFIATERLECL